ncbi:MAG: HAD hydrolase-like protein [Paludibacterium sp.]|uniref:HAD-IIA family hydrolase n=1 Tax=Paludibacterium sp. TaxID=1917523 RepID=UPI0025DF283B|nr:HAD hydrolase-like protein [Paludibacterium sp.]MBV8049071.1 HAD hydrolase-like protein [Paludibacterium sp.]MBV8649419.1 HAD hydrolase-like protein [Paludibacterium sp.]
MSDALFSPLIFDLHGVLLGRAEPPGHLPAGEVLAQLRAAGHALRFLTNASSASRRDVAAQLAEAGVEAAVDEVYTAAMTVAHFLRADGRPRRVYLVGSPALGEEIERTCGEFVSWVAPEEADTVVVGRAPDLDEDTLRRLAAAPRPLLVATCRDAAFADGAGSHAGPGQTVVRVERALATQALVLGKPNPYVLSEVMGLSAMQRASSVVIGDSPRQDVALAHLAGTRSVLLSSPGAAAAGPAPDHRIEALDQLLSLLCR